MNHVERDWLGEYGASHTHPVNRWLHTWGIPMIAVSVVLAAAALLLPRLWIPAAALFVVGWIFQLVGHVYERKPPEFLSHPRFLFVGLRWWFMKLRGKA